MPFKDSEKRRIYRREWYKKNSSSEKAHVSRRKNELRNWFADYKKDLKCLNCSENHPATLDFHHKSNKEFLISHMIANGYSINRIKKELSKCQVLCSNCHRKLHNSNKKL